jgi:hypothetical protein
MIGKLLGHGTTHAFRETLRSEVFSQGQKGSLTGHFLRSRVT